MRVRSFASIPKSVVLFVVISLSAQIFWHSAQPGNQAQARELVSSPGISGLRVLSFGDPVFLAKILMLWLQAFDNQPGVSVPYNDLDYDKLEGWLESILQLDPGGQYPLLAASRLYAQVPDEAKQRQMLDFVYQQFLVDPENRWPWLAHASLVAKHRLKDLPLALKFSRAIVDKSSSNDIPAWASQLQLMVLEEMGELEAMQFLIGGLLTSGKITDPKEVNYLNQRMQALSKKIN
jgi:hypothetical protein